MSEQDEPQQEQDAPKTSRDHALYALQEDDRPGSAQRAQAFALLAVADELTAMRVAFGSGAQSLGPALGNWFAGVGADVRRIADAQAPPT